MGLRDLFRRKQAGDAASETASPAGEDPTEADRRVVEQLTSAGADIGEPREVSHSIRLPNREAADALGPVLLNEGYQPRIVEPQPGTDDALPWTLVATSRSVASDEAVSAARRRFTELAAEYGGRYDGWEAAV